MKLIPQHLWKNKTYNIYLKKSSAFCRGRSAIVSAVCFGDSSGLLDGDFCSTGESGLTGEDFLVTSSSSDSLSLPKRFLFNCLKSVKFNNY